MRHSRYLAAASAARWCAVATTSLAAGSLLASCDAPAPLAPPASPSLHAAGSAPAERGDVRATERRLERAAQGLLYTSESDHPFTYLRSAYAVPLPATPAAVARTFGFDASASVEVVTLDAFFARHVDRVDLADEVAVARIPAYRRLRETLRRAGRDVMVYRIGTIAIDCLIVGVDRDGHLVGMRTIAIET